MTEITLYGASWCAACQQAKKWFTDNNHEFTYKDVDNDTYKQELASLGYRSVPVTVITTTDKKELILGFNIKKYQELLP